MVAREQNPNAAREVLDIGGCRSRAMSRRHAQTAQGHNNPRWRGVGFNGFYSRRQLLANAAIAASRVGWNLGAAASERQYLASLRNLLANDYAATYLDASFVAVIAARRWNVGWMRGISGSARWSRCHNRFESNGLDH